MNHRLLSRSILAATIALLLPQAVQAASQTLGWRWRQLEFQRAEQLGRRRGARRGRADLQRRCRDFSDHAFHHCECGRGAQLGQLSFTGTTGDYTFSGSDVRLNTSTAISIASGNTATITLGNNLVLGGSLAFNNTSATATGAASLVLNGGLSLEATQAAARVLTLNPNDADATPDIVASITVNGIISNGGTTGASLGITKNGNGNALITMLPTPTPETPTSAAACCSWAMTTCSAPGR